MITCNGEGCENQVIESQGKCGKCLGNLSEREEIIFEEKIDWEERKGGVESFEKLSKEKVTELIEKGFLDPDSRQNYSPTADEFLSFMEKAEKYPGVRAYAHGYVVSPERSDCRVTLEGISVEAYSRSRLPVSLICSFGEKFGRGDEVRMIPDCCYVWYD